jgi:hypothetical protein
MKQSLKQAFLGFFLLSSLMVFAQKKVLPGFYINQQGDTIKGMFPTYTQWDRNPAQVQFEPSGAAKMILLTPQTCRKFVIEGFDEYLSFTGSRLVNPIDDHEVIKNQNFTFTSDTLENITAFLRLVTTTAGGALYVYKDAKRINFFHLRSNEPMTELRYKKSYDNGQITESPDYRQQLNNAFYQQVQENNLYSSLERLNYNEDDLAEFFQKLFPNKKVKKTKNPAAGWFVSAGVSLNDVQIKTDDGFTVLARKYKISAAPLLSVGYYVPVDRNFGRYFLYPQVKLFRYKNTGEFMRGSFLHATTYKADFMGTGEVSVGMNVLNQESVRFYLSAGLGAMLQVYGKQVEELFRPENHTLYIQSAVNLTSLTYAMNASAGVTLTNRYMISATYMLPSQIGNFLYYTPQLFGLQIRFGYKLK